MIRDSDFEEGIARLPHVTFEIKQERGKYVAINDGWSFLAMSAWIAAFLGMVAAPFLGLPSGLAGFCTAVVILTGFWSLAKLLGGWHVVALVDNSRTLQLAINRQTQGTLSIKADGVMWADLPLTQLLEMYNLPLDEFASALEATFQDRAGDQDAFERVRALLEAEEVGTKALTTTKEEA